MTLMLQLLMTTRTLGKDASITPNAVLEMQ